MQKCANTVRTDFPHTLSNQKSSNNSAAQRDELRKGKTARNCGRDLKKPTKQTKQQKKIPKHCRMQK